MKHLALALLLIIAQDKKGKKGGLSGQENRLSEAVKLHYVTATPDPGSLKTALEKVKGVEGVTFVPNENSVTVMFAGPLEGLRAVEAAGAAGGVPVYLLSHCTVLMSMKAEKGADVNAFFKELDELEGVKDSAKREGGVTILCNLEQVALDALTAVAEKHKFKAEISSHDLVDVYTTGDKYAELLKQLNAVKGLALVRIDNQSGIAKCVGPKKGSTDESIKKAVEKAGMKLNEIKRR